METAVILFWVLAGLTGLCAIAVVVTQNIVRAATWLLFALGGTAGIFFLLGADFVGATQLLVYVGGTLVLVIFGVMLTAQGPFIHMRVSAAEWAVALVVGLLLYGALAASLLIRPPLPDAQPVAAAEFPGSGALGLAFLGTTQVTPSQNITGVPREGYNPLPLPKGEPRPTFIPPSTPRDRHKVAYLLPFEIVSVHLLVVLIGAAYLARAKRRRQPTTGASA
jgi:NADH:ubiquinone oxidoreductase subunit 6 (subunit J)